MYHVYILQSESSDNFYTGVTNNLKRRLLQHNKGQSRSTKPYLPWKLIYSEEYEDKSTAYKREFYLKSPSGYTEKRALIENHRF